MKYTIMRIMPCLEHVNHTILFNTFYMSTSLFLLLLYLMKLEGRCKWKHEILGLNLYKKPFLMCCMS